MAEIPTTPHPKLFPNFIEKSCSPTCGCSEDIKRAAVALPLKCYFSEVPPFQTSTQQNFAISTTTCISCTFLTSIIACSEHQRRPGVRRPLLCSAVAAQGVTEGALWVNACQTFTFSKNTHAHKTRGVDGVFMRD